MANRWLIVALTFYVCLASHAQVIVGNYGINYIATAPSGPCSINSPIQVVIGLGTLYSCQNGSWTKIGESTGPTGANPSQSIGLSVVNGSASTFMRSDGAPAIDQSISPVWTGQHIFNTRPRFGSATPWDNANLPAPSSSSQMLVSQINNTWGLVAPFVDVSVQPNGAFTVIGIHGSQVPTSANLIGTNANGQLVANTTQYLTNDAASNIYAPLDSPELTGLPTSPTQPTNDASDDIATTNFVQNAIQNGVGTPYDIIVSYTGSIPPPTLIANQSVVSYLSNRSIEIFPTKSSIFVQSSSAGNAVFPVTLDGDSIGNVTINGTQVTWNLTEDFNTVLPIQRGSFLLIQAPSTPDASLGGLTIVLSGQTTAPLGQ